LDRGDPNGFAYVFGRNAGDAGMAFRAMKRGRRGVCTFRRKFLESIPDLAYIGVGVGTCVGTISASGLDAVGSCSSIIERSR
jgi:hypothetical protein